MTWRPAAARFTSWGSSPTRASTRPSVTCGRWCVWRGERGVDRVFIHAFTDGRDTSPVAGEGYMVEMEEFLRAEGLGAVATVSGRYYAMDRDRRWDRVKLAYDALVHDVGLHAPRRSDRHPRGVRPRRDRRVHHAHGDR